MTEQAQNIHCSLYIISTWKTHKEETKKCTKANKTHGPGYDRACITYIYIYMYNPVRTSNWVLSPKILIYFKMLQFSNPAD